MITNPHAALFVVEKPAELSSAQERNWPSLLAELQTLAKRTEGSERPNETLVLIPLKNGLPTLTRLCAEAEKHEFGYRVLFLAEGHTWFRSDATI